MAPVCASGSPLTRADLEQGSAALLHSRTRPHAWTSWAARAGITLKAQQTVFYEHFYLALQAAAPGQGVAMASVHMVAGDLAAGHLKTLGSFEPDGIRYTLLTEAPVRTGSRSARLGDWLAGRPAAHHP